MRKHGEMQTAESFALNSFRGNDQMSRRSSMYTASAVACNRPRSIYRYSNMSPRLSGLTSIFGVVFFVSKSPLGIEGQKKL